MNVETLIVVNYEHPHKIPSTRSPDYRHTLTSLKLTTALTIRSEQQCIQTKKTLSQNTKTEGRTRIITQILMLLSWITKICPIVQGGCYTVASMRWLDYQPSQPVAYSAVRKYDLRLESTQFRSTAVLINITHHPPLGCPSNT